MAQQISSLAVGAKVRDPNSKIFNVPIIWKIADKNHSGYPANSVTLIAERSLALRAFDAMEPSNNNENRRNAGNNRYLHSNIRQWLNSEADAGLWYTAQHNADTPPIADNLWKVSGIGINPYDMKAGFISAFSLGLKAALMSTTLIVARNTVTDGGGSETVTEKVFLASVTEVGLLNVNGIAEGVLLPLFSGGQAARVAQVTTEGIADSNYTSPANNTVAWNWWLRSPDPVSSQRSRQVEPNGTENSYAAYSGMQSVRPLCNIPSTTLVSDTVDGDGCYTLIFNQPPTTPPSITPPTSVTSGQTARVQWEASTDPDGDAITYVLERGYNDGGYMQVYSGPELFYSDSITAEMNTVTWRVKARDTFGNESEWQTSATITVKHLKPPAVIPSANILLTVYDPKTLTPIGLLEEITSLLWTRRYWAVGEFKLLLPYTEHHAQIVKNGRLIGKRGDKELGEIRYISIRRNAWGMEEIEAQGKFLTNWLDKRMVWSRFMAEDNTQNILHTLVNQNAINPGKSDRIIPNLYSAGNEPPTGAGVISFAAEQYKSLLKTCEDAARAAMLGFRIETDIRAKRHYFLVYKGIDHAAGQTENMPCVFSPEFDNVLEQSFTQSVENVRTFAIVGGFAPRDAPCQMAEAGGGAGLDRSEIYVDGSDVDRQTWDVPPGTTYEDLLARRGQIELEKYAESLNFTSKIDLNVTPRYKIDFDVGDRVTCVNRRWGVSINSRVTEVIETYQQGKVELNVTFGVSLPTLFDMFR